jgi:N-acetylglucosamine kinase-like BadF-type ATPase
MEFTDMRYILAVDGGGSKTYAVVTDEHGNRLGTGMAGSGNHQTVGMDKAVSHIRIAIHKALASACLDSSEISFCQFGLAGADRERDFAILRPALQALPFSAWDLVCDTMEGLRMGSPGNVGVVLVCGTGTNAAGRTLDGRTVQTGGFGYVFGDASGGSHLALETFRAAIRAWELREEPTMLVDLVAEQLGFRSIQQVFHTYLDDTSRAIPNELTLVLHRAANQGDRVAIRILQEAGRELGLAAISVLRRLGDFGTNPIPVVLVGSVLQKGRNAALLAALRSTVERELRDHDLAVEFVIPDLAPVYGAILLGMDHLGIAVTEETMQRLMADGGDVQ